jgi:hypothetical protein
MKYHPFQRHKRLMEHIGSQPKESYQLGPLTTDPIEQERLAQLEEHKRRQGQGAEDRLIFQKDNHTRRLQRKP